MRVVCGRSGQTASRYSTCCCVISGPRRAHADAVLRFREAGESSILSLSRPRHSRRLSRALHRLACSSTSSHPSLPRTPAKPTNISRHHCLALFFLLISHYTKHLHPAQSNPSSRKRTLPHALYHPSTIIVHIPACPCPDTPSCDSTIARLTTPTLPYNPSRASAPSVNHLPSLPSARRHCAALHRRRSHLINHPIYRTIHQRLRVHSNSSSNQPRHHSTLQQTIHTTPPMRALKSPNLWRIL